MDQSRANIVVFHRYGAESHYLAIHNMVCSYIVCDPFIISGKILRSQIALGTGLKILKGMFKDFFFHKKSKNYVYGFAPESLYFILLCLLWWRPGHRVLHTSFSDDPSALNLVSRYVLGCNLLFSRQFFHAAAAVSVSTENVVKGYMKTALVEHSVDVNAYLKYDIRAGLVYLGRITPYKNVDRIIQAVQKEGPFLDLIGPIEMDRPPSTGSTGFARYLGVRSKDWIKDNLGRYEALVLPSEMREPFGIVLLEAMSAGVLIVASKTHGTRTIFRNWGQRSSGAWGEYPLLYDTMSPEGLDYALIKLKAMSEPQKSSLRAELMFVAENYQPTVLRQRWEGVLR